MKISTKNRKIITDELKFIRKKMESEPNLNRKNYYYSGTYGMIQRIFNIDYDPLLVFMHNTFFTSHSNISRLLQLMGSGNLDVVIDEKFFKQLAQNLHELELIISKKEDEKIYHELEKIICLAFFTTGNGYYLAQKGIKLVPID